MTKKQIAADLHEAKRLRMGAIGLMECCRCSWPVQRHDTPSFHAPNCPAAYFIESAISAGTYSAVEFTRLARREAEGE